MDPLPPPPPGWQDLDLMETYNWLGQNAPGAVSQYSGTSSMPSAPAMTGASRFLPTDGSVSGFVPDYSYFYNPFNFVNQTPQPSFSPPFMHVAPPEAQPGPPIMAGPAQFPQVPNPFLYGPEQMGQMPMTPGMPQFQQAPQAPAQSPYTNRWVSGQGGNLKWIGPQGAAWESPEMVNPYLGGGFQVNPATGQGVNRAGDPVSISGGRVVPQQPAGPAGPSLANTWALSQTGKKFWIGPSGYKWAGPEMTQQLGLGDQANWRINPVTGYGTNSLGQQILVKQGQVFPA